MATQVSIDRSSLSLSALVVASTYQTGLYLAAEGLGRPAKTWVRNYATARDWNGAVPTDARLDQSTVPLAIYIQGTSTADLESRYATLEAALYQFTYDLTVTVDGTTKVWAAEAADLVPAGYDVSFTLQFLQLVAVTIPVYPVSS
jgi:hypothetical protein